MNKKNKKWLTRLAAGAMALLLAAGTAATDLTVYAADQSAQECKRTKDYRICRIAGKTKDDPSNRKDRSEAAFRKDAAKYRSVFRWRERENEYSGNMELCR